MFRPEFDQRRLAEVLRAALGTVPNFSAPPVVPHTAQGKAVQAAPAVTAQSSDFSKSPLRLNSAGLGSPQQAAAAYGAAEAPDNKWVSALGGIGAALSKVLGQRGTDPRVNMNVPLGLTFAEAEAVRNGQLAKFSAEADAAAKNADAEYRRAMADFQRQALGMQERKFNEVELPLGQAQIVQAQQEAELARQTMGDRVAAAGLANERSRAQLTTEQAQADRAAETVQAALDEADAKRRLIGAQAEDIPENRKDVRARLEYERAADEARIGLGYANLRESKNQNAFARDLAINQLALDQYKTFSDAAADLDKLTMSLGGSSGGLSGPDYDQLNASFNSSLLDLAQKALLSMQKNGVKYEVPPQLGQLLGLPGKGLPTEGATKTPTPTELMMLVAGVVQASNDPALIAEMGVHEAAFASSVQNVAATTTKNADGSITVTQGGRTVIYPESEAQKAAKDAQKRVIAGYDELVRQASK
ncbi:MAG: hypothetical protein BWY63_00273 [Chloroflexi bacterium ADurb.Bin360]|nr:MAG: hypothetical protein BWY63_00273 [Chloroflexi bacterium ADurb.Bin360]